eukprot:m.343286 g.343286  ORF g.343286 m.343286 type:complete len:576 (-) comp22645_c0_seq1:80-1807(-)
MASENTGGATGTSPLDISSGEEKFSTPSSEAGKTGFVPTPTPHLHRLLATMRSRVHSPNRRSSTSTTHRESTTLNGYPSNNNDGGGKYSALASMGQDPSPTDLFYTRLLRALESQHQQQTWEMQQSHERELQRTISNMNSIMTPTRPSPTSSPTRYQTPGAPRISSAREYNSSSLEQLESECASLKEQLKETKAKLTTEQRATSELQSALTKAKENVERLKLDEPKNIHESSQDPQGELNRLHEMVDRLMRQQEPTQKVLKELVAEHKKLKDDYQKATTRNISLETQLTQTQRKLEIQTTDLENINYQKDDINEYKRKMAGLEKDLMVLRNKAQEDTRVIASLQEQQHVLTEEHVVLKAKHEDVKAERDQLREETKRLERALDRLRWPPGTHPPNSPGSKHDRQSTQENSYTSHNPALSFPRAPDANAESGFNIFTGEAQATSRSTDFYRHKNNPETRMVWISDSMTRQSQNEIPKGVQHTAATQTSLISQKGEVLQNEKTSEAIGEPKPSSSTRDDVVARLLRDRLVDMGRERLQLEKDLASGLYADKTTQINADKRMALLDEQITDIQRALLS